jgi:hypothetical protein
VDPRDQPPPPPLLRHLVPPRPPEGSNLYLRRQQFKANTYFSSNLHHLQSLLPALQRHHFLYLPQWLLHHRRCRPPRLLPALAGSSTGSTPVSRPPPARLSVRRQSRCLCLKMKATVQGQL